MDVLNVAKYVVDYCTRRGTPVSNKELQKILYYIQINFYRKLQKAAFKAEFQAWECGPVIPTVYDAYYSYSSTPICNLYESVRDIYEGEEKNLVNAVIDACIELGTQELIKRSSRVGGPWNNIYKQGRYRIIPDEVIKAHATKEESPRYAAKYRRQCAKYLTAPKKNTIADALLRTFGKRTRKDKIEKALSVKV